MPSPLIIVVCGVGSHQRIGIGDAAALVHGRGQVLEVDLVHDPDLRDDSSAVEGGHSPFEEFRTGRDCA